MLGGDYVHISRLRKSWLGHVSLNIPEVWALPPFVTQTTKKIFYFGERSIILQEAGSTVRRLRIMSPLAIKHQAFIISSCGRVHKSTVFLSYVINTEWRIMCADLWVTNRLWTKNLKETFGDPPNTMQVRATYDMWHWHSLDIRSILKDTCDAKSAGGKMVYS